MIGLFVGMCLRQIHQSVPLNGGAEALETGFASLRVTDGTSLATGNVDDIATARTARGTPCDLRRNLVLKREAAMSFVCVESG